MRMFTGVSVALVLALAACGQPTGAGAEGAQAGAAQAGEVDTAALLAALNMTANAQGQVLNACEEWVTPTVSAAELGGAAGTAQLVAIGGGPNMASCYGDGPDIHLMVNAGGNWREVYSDRGGMLIILATEHDGVRDIADGGPGFSFPVWQWNGNAYVSAGRNIADADLGDATFLP